MKNSQLRVVAPKKVLPIVEAAWLVAEALSRPGKCCGSRNGAHTATCPVGKLINRLDECVSPEVDVELMEEPKPRRGRVAEVSRAR